MRYVPTTCSVCHQNLDPAPELAQDYFICDDCIENNPIRVDAFWEERISRGKELFNMPPHERLGNVSKNGFYTTQEGTECWTWVIAHDEDYTPILVPGDRQKIGRSRTFSGPYPTSQARAVKVYLLHREPTAHLEVYDFTGFLMSPNYERFQVDNEEIVQLIHAGQIRYVFHSVGYSQRKWHFPSSQSFITSFLGHDRGWNIVNYLRETRHIIWNEQYQVYVTRYFDPTQPPYVRLPNNRSRVLER